MLLVGLSHCDTRKRNFIIWLGATWRAVKGGPVVFIDNVRKRIETFDEVFTNFNLFSVATVLNVAAGLLVPPL